MSTTSKQSSKKVSKEETNSELENSEMENDKHSIFNGKFKKNPSEAQNFLSHFDATSNELYDKESAEKVLKFIWGESYEALIDLVKKNKNKEKIKKSKFVSKDLVKPKIAINIFNDVFSKESEEKNIKFGKDNNNYLICRNAAWKKLSDGEREIYNKQAKNLLETYKANLAIQKAEAVKNGEFPADKIKSPPNAYILFLNDIRSSLNKKYVDVADKNNKISSEAGLMWKSMSEKEKEKYYTAYNKLKSEYDANKLEKQTIETERKKQNGEIFEENVEIESSGKKIVSKDKSKSKSKTSEEEEDVDVDVDVDVEELTKSIKKVDIKDDVEVKPSKKTKSKTKVKVDSEEEDKNDEDEDLNIEELTKSIKKVDIKIDDKDSKDSKDGEKPKSKKSTSGKSKAK